MIGLAPGSDLPMLDESTALRGYEELGLVKNIEGSAAMALSTSQCYCSGDFGCCLTRLHFLTNGKSQHPPPLDDSSVINGSADGSLHGISSLFSWIDASGSLWLGSGWTILAGLGMIIAGNAAHGFSDGLKTDVDALPSAVPEGSHLDVPLPRADTPDGCLGLAIRFMLLVVNGAALPCMLLGWLLMGLFLPVLHPSKTKSAQLSRWRL
ncbi:hypothetical protein Nepgr_028943 [Nepenthes gracilis]|uniref:Uncharacterized protein n=1 Tax=Nepenthes gracilis TaxID=150966 RepID=A0AAD3TCN1_NEPGR|nr:hypothetical protein Nepgr_028943 [Nepenthes gracilis]